MKPLLLAVFGISASVAVAQNIQDQKVTFKYTQLPSVSINDGSKTFSLLPSMGYQQRNQDSLSVYNTALEQYKTELMAAVDLWETQKLAVDKQYYTAMATYETQVAAGNTAAVKPTKAPYPGIPFAKAKPRKPVLMPDLNANAIAQGVKIEGFTQTASSGVRIEMVFEGFDRGIPKLVQTGAAPAIKYAYEVTYRQPVSIKIDFPGKGIIVNEKVPSTESFRSYRTAEYKTKAELEMWWNENQNLVWEDRQKNISNEMVPEINNYLNEKYGYPVKSRMVEVYTVKSKDFDYSDYLNAYQAFQDGVMMLQYGNQIAQAQAKLQTAIDLWNNALKESNINDKKARVDKTITACTYVNLAEAYIWMNDFSNAEINANKALNIDVGKYNKDAKPKLDFIRDMRNRYQASGK